MCGHALKVCQWSDAQWSSLRLCLWHSWVQSVVPKGKVLLVAVPCNLLSHPSVQSLVCSWLLRLVFDRGGGVWDIALLCPG